MSVERDAGVVITGSRQVAELWAKQCVRVLTQGTSETALADAAELRFALEGAIQVIRDLADIAERAGVTPAPRWVAEATD